MLEWMQTAFRHRGSPETWKGNTFPTLVQGDSDTSPIPAGRTGTSDLIIHEGHQRGDDQGDALGALVVEVSGELVAKRLPHPCGQHHQGGETWQNKADGDNLEPLGSRCPWGAEEEEEEGNPPERILMMATSWPGRKEP